MHHHRSYLHMSPNCRHICISLPLYTPTSIRFFPLRAFPSKISKCRSFNGDFHMLLSLNAMLTLNAGNNLLSFTSHPGRMNHAESLRVHFNISIFQNTPSRTLQIASRFGVFSSPQRRCFWQNVSWLEVTIKTDVTEACKRQTDLKSTIGVHQFLLQTTGLDVAPWSCEAWHFNDRKTHLNLKSNIKKWFV